MGKIYPLPEQKSFRENSFHEIGVILDHFLHSQDLLEQQPIAHAYFGEYLATASYYRKDRARGTADESTTERIIYPPTIVPGKEKPLCDVPNKMHADLRSLAQQFFDLAPKDDKDFDKLDGTFKKTIAAYRAANERRGDDVIRPKLDPKDYTNLSSEIQHLLSPPQKNELTLKQGDTIITIDNTKPLDPQFSQSYPALVLFCAGKSGFAMIDTEKIPVPIRDYLTKIIGNEADITFLMNLLEKRAGEQNLDKQFSFPKLNYDSLAQKMTSAANVIALNYHFHSLFGKAVPESLEAIKRLHWFAAGEPENHSVPLVIQTNEEAGMILSALAARAEKIGMLSEPDLKVLKEYAANIARDSAIIDNFKCLADVRLQHFIENGNAICQQAAKSLQAYFPPKASDISR